MSIPMTILANPYLEFKNVVPFVGYKFSRGNWTIKGKWEGTDSHQRDTFNSKLETEIRFTFGE